jgi:hypothetical protein
MISSSLEKLLNTSFSMWSMSYQRKVDDQFFPELLVDTYMQGTDSICLTLKWCLHDLYLLTKLKITKVKPLYKKGLNTHVGNYRPVTLISVFFFKIIKKFVYRRLFIIFK